MAATGVSLCLYYLAYNQDAMERVQNGHNLHTLCAAKSLFCYRNSNDSRFNEAMMKNVLLFF